MLQLVLSIPLLLALVAVILAVTRSMVAAWFNYRVKLELLRRLEQDPELVSSPEEMRELLRTALPASPSDTTDYALTGTALGLIGIGCVLIGRMLRVGQFAAGMFWGGMACIAIGLLLVLIGVVLRFVTGSVGARTIKP